LETKIRDARLPSAFWVLFTGQLVNRIGNMVATTLVFFLRSTGLDVAGVGVVLVALSIGTLFSQPAAGLLADRFGPRRTLIGGMIATAGCMAGLGTVRGLVPLAVSAASL
jgi:MFS family permease